MQIKRKFYSLKVDKIPIFCRLRQEVPNFKYFGSTLISNGHVKNESEARIMVAKNVYFHLMKPLWSRYEITIKTKVRVQMAAVRSILLWLRYMANGNRADKIVYDFIHLHSNTTCFINHKNTIRWLIYFLHYSLYI